MKMLITIFGFLTLSFAASADDINSIVLTETAMLELRRDTCEDVISMNKLITLGEPAVQILIDVLGNPRNGLKMKWGVAQVLGEIGSKKAIPALQQALKSDNEWLRDTAKQSISLINNELKRAGKVYLWTIGTQTTRTTCETGVVEVIK